MLRHMRKCLQKVFTFIFTLIFSFVLMLALTFVITVFLYAQVTTKPDFDIKAYMGKWYESEKYPNSFQKGDCGFAQYVLQDDGTVAVNNTERKPDGSRGTAIGQVRTNYELH